MGIDLTGLNYYLSLNYVPCPYTLVEGVRKLPPGHWLSWQPAAASSCSRISGWISDHDVRSAKMLN